MQGKPYHKASGNEPAHSLQVVEIERKSVRRSEIRSPKEKDAVTRRFVFWGKSVTTLSNQFQAEETAIENVLRQRMFHILPPAGRKVAAA